MARQGTLWRRVLSCEFLLCRTERAADRYKVLVLTVGENDVPDNIKRDITDTTTELNFDDTSKLIGVINGLSKMIQGDDHRTWDADPHMMRRAVAFCSSIDKSASRTGICIQICCFRTAANIGKVRQKSGCGKPIAYRFDNRKTHRRLYELTGTKWNSAMAV